MNEDSEFVRAILANPDDEALRPAYVEWLEVRADPRGSYLRAEQAWTPQATERTAREQMTGLSRLAKSIDPFWLVTVSRVAREVRIAWDNLTHLPDVQRNGLAPDEPVIDLVNEVAALTEAVSNEFGAEVAETRLCFPVDYLLFLGSDGGKWLWDEWGDIYPTRGLAPTLLDDLETFANRGRQRLDDGLWIHVADWHDRDGYFLCVDARHPRFGVVARGENCHPWEGGVESLRIVSPTFLHFLREALPGIIERG